MSRVLVVTTGGTIASAADDSGVLRPGRTGAELVRAAGFPDVEAIDVMAKDSSELTVADWDTIASVVASAVEDGVDGVVITHGTDTLEETALWLELTYGGSAPVVLTGAAHSADGPDADGPANLRDAVALAGSAGARGLGVLISFGGAVLAPLGTQKVSGGFNGPHVADRKDRPFLGVVSAASAPRVDVIACYLGADGVALDACVAAGARGVVLEAMGAGNVSDAIVGAVRRYCAAGVTVAVSTRVPFGTVSASYGPGAALASAGALAVPRLRAAQARVLLMAALATGSPVRDVVARWG
ncbi:MAG: asparaginase [Mycobacteriaceae bacterium]|nr:asparaginase [Mycobacteriaceae bacterium]